MAKRRRSAEEDDDDFVNDDNQQRSCTTLDHVYPSDANEDTRCFCGKRRYRPLIKLDDYLHEGMIIQREDGTLYRVEMVSESRARCRRTTVERELNREERYHQPVFMPLPGTPNLPEDDLPDDWYSPDASEENGHVLNISPRSVCRRVEYADLIAMTRKESTMAVKGAAAIPVGKTNKAQKLAQKPKSEARPLTGAAARAKANAKPKVTKTVRECGCGCKDETMSYFVPGHDARYKGWMKKLADGRLSQDELKKLMGPKTFGKYTFKKSGAGFVPKETYQEVAGN